MFLRQLPPEILLHILRFLGSAFFRHDARRLLISKWWYQLAWPLFLEDLDFSAESLQKFVLASKREGMIDSIQTYVSTVSLSLNGFENWHSAQPRSSSAESSNVDFHIVNTWTSELNGCLTTLASILRQCTRLRTFRLQARPESHDPRLGLQRRDYLMALPLANLASISHLSCLEIDTAGTSLISQDTPRIHLCSNISKMLPTLQRLRCRMGSICPHIFDVPRKDLLFCLEDFIINLSLSDISGSDSSYRYPSRCGYVPGDSFPQLKADMELHATRLVRMIESLRVVRILSHTFPGLDMHSFDPIKERHMLLAPDAPWDAEGEEVEERSTASDLFDSDSASEGSLQVH